MNNLRIWTPKPTERVLIANLPENFVRACDGTSLITVWAALCQGLPQLNTRQVTDLYAQFIARRNARREGRGIVETALSASEFTADELAEMRRTG